MARTKIKQAVTEATAVPTDEQMAAVLPWIIQKGKEICQRYGYCDTFNMVMDEMFGQFPSYDTYIYSGYNRQGYDRDGYDRTGYDRDGFRRDGYNAYGHDRDGYDRDGYDRRGFDRNGLNRHRYDVDGVHHPLPADEASSE